MAEQQQVPGSGELYWSRRRLMRFLMALCIAFVLGLVISWVQWSGTTPIMKPDVLAWNGRQIDLTQLSSFTTWPPADDNVSIQYLSNERSKDSPIGEGGIFAEPFTAAIHFRPARNFASQDLQRRFPSSADPTEAVLVHCRVDQIPFHGIHRLSLSLPGYPGILGYVGSPEYIDRFLQDGLIVLRQSGVALNLSDLRKLCKPAHVCPAPRPKRDDAATEGEAHE